MKTYINVILDKSGSMQAVLTDTIGGFNTWLKNQKAVAGKQSLTLTMFDTKIVTVHQGMDLSAVPELTLQSYVPGGNTALLDAIGKTILGIPAKARKVLVVIITDGQENSSHEYTRAAIKNLIDQKTAAGWTFAYIGASQEGFAEAGALGINLRSQYAATPTGTQAAFMAMSSGTMAYAGSPDASSARSAYTNTVASSIPDPGEVVTHVGPVSKGAAKDLAKQHARKVADTVAGKS